jgi:hypothetical protein
MNKGLKIGIFVTLGILVLGGVFVWHKRNKHPKVVVTSIDKAGKTVTLTVNGEQKTVPADQGLMLPKSFLQKAYSIEPALANESAGWESVYGVFLKDDSGAIVQTIEMTA